MMKSFLGFILLLGTATGKTMIRIREETTADVVAAPTTNAAFVPVDDVAMDMASIQARQERRRMLERELTGATSVCTPEVTGFVLWDVRDGFNGVVIGPIESGVVCRPPGRFAIEAVVNDCATTESVEFVGKFPRIENIPKYFWFGDFRGEIFGRRIRNGRRIFATATPYPLDDAMGMPGISKTLDFSFKDCH